MRHVTLLLALAITGLGSRLASATPFEPSTVPDQIQAVGHLDADALRKTQVFAAAGGQAAIDAALDDAPQHVRSVARTLVKSLRGVTFWHDGSHGAVLIETRDSSAVAKLLAKLPGKPAQTVDGCQTYELTSHGSHYAGAYGDTVVLSDSEDSLARALHVLTGKAASLASSNKLPLSTRQGVFVFVTLGDHMLGHIQKAAHSKVLQLGLRSLVVDVSEVGGVVTANAHAEMKSADAQRKAKSILDGLHAMASLSDEPAARMLLDGVTVTANGLAIDVVAKLSVADLTKMIQAAK